MDCTVEQINFKTSAERKRLARILAALMNYPTLQDLMNALLQQAIDQNLPVNLRENTIGESPGLEQPDAGQPREKRANQR